MPAFSCCGVPGQAGADDIGFITAMVAAIGHAIGVNGQRAYATGVSNGGILAYDLACHTTTFAAIGPDSATQLGGPSRSAGGVAAEPIRQFFATHAR